MRYYGLDIIRGLAAVLVLLNHARNLFLENNHIEISNIITLKQLFLIITGLSHECVLFFFIISGFVICREILKNPVDFSAKNYLIKRITRLYVVLIPSLILTYFCHLWLITNFSENFLQERDLHYKSIPNQSTYSADLFTFIGNILFLQTIFVPVYGLNSPLWSLANEFWYYIIFPLLLIFFNLINQNNLHKIIAFFILIALFLFLPISILKYFIIWLLGAFVYLIKNYANKYLMYLSNKILIILSLVIIFYTKINNNIFSFIPRDLLISLIFACIVLKVTENSNYNTYAINKFWNFLANISYTLYLSHFPILILTYIYISTYIENIYICFFILIILNIIICIFLWYIFERNTKKVQKLFLKNY